MNRAVAAVCVWGALGGAAQAQDWGDEGDDFGDLPTVTAPIELEAVSPWGFSGFYRSEVGLGTERIESNPVAKLRQSLDLEATYRAGDLRVLVAGHGEYDPAYIHDRAGYDQPTLDTYELRYLDGEQYVAYAAGDIEFIVGRQIVAWGEGDVFSPLDVVNPRDLREPGLADLDDLRLSVLATRVSWFLGQHRIEVMGVHELYTGERGAPLSAFSPFRTIVTEDPRAAAILAGREIRWEQVQDRFSTDGQMVLGRWVYKGPGWDLGLYGASVLDYQGVVALPPVAELLTPGPVVLRQDHRRYTLIGHSGATAVDDWLIKWEVAATLDKAYNVGDRTAPVPELNVAEGTLLAPMLGVTYGGFDDTTVSVEVVQGVFLDEPADLLFPADAPQLAVRFSRNLLRERLTLAGAATALGWTAQHGWLVRGEATYEIQDGLKAGVGYITYQPGDEIGPFYGFDDLDRLFVKLRYDFDRASFAQ